MGLIYDRKYRLRVGKPDTQPQPISPRDQGVFKEGFTEIGWGTVLDIRTARTTENAVEIVDLQVVAQVKGDSNTASTATSSTTIKIFNCSPKTLEIIEQENNFVILEGGYRDDLSEEDGSLPILFTGQVFQYETQRQGQNLVTTLYCKEGYSPNNSIKVTKTFKKGTTYAAVLDYLVKIYGENGTPEGEIIYDWLGIRGAEQFVPQDYVQLPTMIGSPASTQLKRSFSLMGVLHKVMEDVCSQIGYVSYITGGRLYVHPKGFTKTLEEYELSLDQIKSIRKSGSKVTSGSNGQGVEGIKVVTFLDGRLDLDKRIKILEGEFEGNYKVITKNHSLDYEGSTWQTTLICKRE